MVSTKRDEYIKNFLFQQNNKLMRLTNFTTSLDFSLSELLAGDKKKNKSTTSANSGADMFSQGYENTRGMSPDQSGEQNQTAVPRDEYGYQQFDVPWSMNISYSLNYSKPGLKSRITQAMTLNGNVTLTKPMAITYISGYDFTGKSITMTSVGIRRGSPLLGDES